jgi:hypothetical protein
MTEGSGSDSAPRCAAPPEIRHPLFARSDRLSASSFHLCDLIDRVEGRPILNVENHLSYNVFGDLSPSERCSLEGPLVPRAHIGVVIRDRLAPVWVTVQIGYV